MTRSDGWWPPKPGDKLRHFTQHASGTWYKQVHAVAYVMAVFEHRGRTLVTVAEWFPAAKRWGYDTIRRSQAEFGEYWPDGELPPEGHRCEACDSSARLTTR